MGCWWQQIGKKNENERDKEKKMMKKIIGGIGDRWGAGGDR